MALATSLSLPLAPDQADLGRRERRKLELRNRILEVSSALFAEQGVEATRIQEICLQADIAEKTFFNHFPSKRHLMREIAQEGVGQLLSDIEAIRKRRTSSAARIQMFFEQVADNALLAGPMQRELLTEMIHVAHETGTEHEQAQLLHEAFGALIAEGVAAGDLTTTHAPETLTEMLMGAFYVLMFNWANLDDYPIRERARATAKFLAGSMARGPDDAPNRPPAS
jgi:AcrR family transcriptional regulator